MASEFIFRETPWQRELPEVMGARHYRFRPPGVITRHQLKFWVLSYPLRCAGVTLRVGDSGPWRPLAAREACLNAPGTLTYEDYRACGEEECRSDYVIFTAGRYDRPLRELCRGGHRRLPDPEGLLGRHMHALAEAAPLGAGRFLAANAELLAMLDLILNASPPSPPPSLAEKLIRLFERDPAADFSIDSLAARLHVSRSTLSHRYARDHGETPMAAVNRMRLELAAALLNRGLPTKSVAAECGFCDEFHLMRNFKRHAGMTVGEYRRQRE